MKRKLYTTLYCLLTPFILMRWLIKSIQEPGFRQNIPQRFGFYQAPSASIDIWFHAVSFGEVEVARPLIVKALEAGLSVLVTTTTASGYQRLAQHFDSKVLRAYAPLEIPFAIKSLLKQFSPKKCVIIETEIWPNLYYFTHASGCPIVIANARLSERSARGYQRIRPLIQPTLSQVSQLLAQTHADKQRFVSLGVSESVASVCGNIKYDIKPASINEDDLQKFQAAIEGRFVFLAASTHPGEEKLLLESFKQIKATLTKCLLIIAPRHPSRADEIAKLIKVQGLKIGRRSQGDLAGPTMDVYLVDTLGELGLFYRLCDCCFVGGSLVPHGGHNVLEPIALNKPVLTGPHTFNFKQICQELLDARGIMAVNDSASVASGVITLFDKVASQEQLIMAARSVYEKNQGALKAQWNYIVRSIS